MTQPITKELLDTLIAAVEDEAREARSVSTSFTLGKGSEYRPPRNVPSILSIS